MRTRKYLVVGLLAVILATSVIALLFFDGSGLAATKIVLEGGERAGESKLQSSAVRQTDLGDASSSFGQQDVIPTLRPPDRRPLPLKASPREMVEMAQQSDSAEHALLAAQSIHFCRSVAWSGQKARDALHGAGVIQPSSRVNALMAGIDKAERACQELDARMLAQYEPMLRRAMNGGLKGAAALWWVTPEAESVTTVASAANALGLLRRDALECEKWSLMTYQAVSIRFKDAFDSVEAAAVRAATAQLQKQGKLKGNRAMGVVSGFLAPSHVLQAILNRDAVETKTAEILRFCQ